MIDIEPTSKSLEGPIYTLIEDLHQLIPDVRRKAATAVNVSLTLLYWRVGDRIRREVLGSGRAGYGEHIAATLCTN